MAKSLLSHHGIYRSINSQMRYKLPSSFDEQIITMHTLEKSPELTIVGNGGLMRVLNACGSETSASPHTSEPISFSSSSCCPWMYKKLGCTTRCASRNCSGVGLNKLCTCIRKPLHSAHTKRGGAENLPSPHSRENTPQLTSNLPAELSSGNG